MAASFPNQMGRLYGFVRSRQLEGTYPGDPATGVWVTTTLRVGAAGEQ